MVSGLHIILQCTQYGFRFTYYITMYAIWFPVYILYFNVRNMVFGLNINYNVRNMVSGFTYYITMYAIWFPVQDFFTVSLFLGDPVDLLFYNLLFKIKFVDVFHLKINLKSLKIIIIRVFFTTHE